MKKNIAILLGIIGGILLILGIVFKTCGRAISIIGGADGPTSIFIAGRVSNAPIIALFVVGLILVIIFVIWIIKKHK